jgi:hypothetical protein
LTAGPTTAVDTSAGAGVKNEVSCSLVKTPGDTILSAIVVWYYIEFFI